MTSPDTLIRLYANTTPQRGQCRGCAADIEWFTTLTGKKMPMNADAVPRKSEHDAEQRVVLYFAASDAHWGTCPERSRFAKGGS